MAAIDEVREYFDKLKSEGSIRTDVPPKPEEKYYNPIEARPRDEIVKMRDERLRFILEWAYEYSEFYHNLWDEAKVKPSDLTCFEDLQKFPFVRKGGKWGVRTDQIQNPPFGKRTVTELTSVPAHYIWSSTGTTGAPTHWVMMKEELEALMETWSREFWATGWRPGMFLFFIVPADRGYEIVFYIWEYLRRNLGATFYYEGMTPFITAPKTVVEKMHTLAKEYTGRFVMLAPASMAIQVGTIFKELGYESPVVSICQMAEIMTKADRKALFELHPKLKNLQYCFTNSDGMATYECEPSYRKFGELGHHIPEDLQFIEVVDPETGKWVKEGERGELVMTDLFRLTTPCIRFSTEDVFINEYTTDVCECGRTHLRWMNPVPGRMNERFRVKGKDLLPWDIQEIITAQPDNTGMYQVVSTDWEEDEVEIHVETTRKLPDEAYEKRVKKALEDGLGVPVKLSLHEVGTFPFRPTYKLVRFADKRPLDRIPSYMAPFKE